MSLTLRRQLLPPFQPELVHSWCSPNHYLFCKRCKAHRSFHVHRAEEIAARQAQLLAESQRQEYQERRIILSPRVLKGQPRAFYQAQNQYKYTSIRVPLSHNSSNTTQALGLGCQLAPGSDRKRRVDCTSHAEPAQYYVPGQFPEEVDHNQPIARADSDFWALNAELIRQAARERAEAATAARVEKEYLSMPGAWPSWADEPDNAPASSTFVPAAHDARHHDDAASSTGHTRGLFTLFGGLSNLVLGAFRTVPWRLTPTHQPGQLQQVQQAVQLPDVVSSTAVAAPVTRVSENRISHSPKRLRSDPGPLRANIPFPRTAFTRRLNTDSAFNHTGHFSLDALYDSDSEDEEDAYPGSPMDIDSPVHLVSKKIETKPALESTLGRPRSILKSSHKTPVVSNLMGPNSVANQSGPSVQRASPSESAARRAVRMFPKESAVKRRISNNAVNLQPPVGERVDHDHQELSTSEGSSKVRSPEDTLHHNVFDFFPREIIHSLPGLGTEELPADTLKIKHLKLELMERMRLEEIESQNRALTLLGVRQPKSPLIREPPPEWMKRALDAPHTGHFNPTAVHPDAVELKPRDFAKLVPPTAWLNDDCVHSTLCCLAAYINNKAGVKPKVDTPKCVAVSSIYWAAFCGDHKKLYPRLFSRKWGMNPDNFLDIDTVLIPVNLHAHWTLIVLRPSRRTVSYIDSYHSQNQRQINFAFEWLELFLGKKLYREEWTTNKFESPQQTNAYDCGVFVITNSMCIALGVTPLCYTEEDLSIQRLQIAAMLLHGGFDGPFDLSHV
ncbi:hypothetical protein NPX13_g3897 [Xylaria arbuscula]|uniref:Ubiquitin-like protease family profile domain-containing protein n=1 Tax=Xylaria arbuscula TaxID=114810 RepID=A0A9W8TMS0_9PEZI|nr:hypothetical protein NPX13_g3897 [Xylaria arbuscula]